MQVLKEEIRRDILKNAAEHFAVKGYEKTGMKSIAGKTGTSVSNVYKYFPSKGDLFTAIVLPVKKKIDRIFFDLFLNNRKGHTGSGEEQVSVLEEVSSSFAGLIKEHRMEFIILLDKSAGTAYENQKNELTGIIKDHFENNPLFDYKTHLLFNSGIIDIIANSIIEGLLVIARNYRDDEWVNRTARAFIHYQFNGIFALVNFPDRYKEK